MFNLRIFQERHPERGNLTIIPIIPMTPIPRSATPNRIEHFTSHISQVAIYGVDSIARLNIVTR